MDKFILQRGTVVSTDDGLICWDKVAYVIPADDSSKTKVVFDNGHWVIIEKDTKSFEKELKGTSKEA